MKFIFILMPQKSGQTSFQTSCLQVSMRVLEESHYTIVAFSLEKWFCEKPTRNIHKVKIIIININFLDEFFSCFHILKIFKVVIVIASLYISALFQFIQKALKILETCELPGLWIAEFTSNLRKPSAEFRAKARAIAQRALRARQMFCQTWFTVW